MVKENSQRGQVLPLVAVGLLAGSLLAYAIVRTAVSVYERTRRQTSADATALATATCYARGLNVCAASNRLLIPAGIADALRALAGQPPLFVPMVMKFQDAWAGTSSLAWVTSSAGIAPLYMQSVAYTVGAENGLQIAAVWNGDTSRGGLAPGLNVKRATPIDIALWLAGKHPTSRPGRGGQTVTWKKTIEKKEYSYQPRGGGSRVAVPASQVEEVEYISRGRTERRYRLKSAPGSKGGQFVRRDTATKKISSSIPLPMPLIEMSRTHQVLILGVAAEDRRNAASFLPSSFVVRSQAEVGQGEVFNELMGDPSFEARLIPVRQVAGNDWELASALTKWVGRGFFEDYILAGR